MIVRARGAFLGSLVALAVLLGVVWAPAAVLRKQAAENKVTRAIDTREIYVSPAELATLMHDRQVSLALFDLRDESAYNVFHLLDARRATDFARVRALPDKTVKILIGDDERVATDAYRTLALAGKKQVYVLAGGVRAWLDLFGRPREGAPTVLAGALGERHPASYPDIEHWTLPKFEPKVKLGAGAKKASAGCGG
jgi:rhodanese-related sulfurtransferase